MIDQPLLRCNEDTLRHAIEKNEPKVVLLYGPRQAGKTTLLHKLIPHENKDAFFFEGDDIYTQEIFGRNELPWLTKHIGNKKIIVIDEAQRIENIGLSLKLLVDHLPVTIIASGSASFELANKLNEPLTGRSQTFWVYPFLWQEIQERYRQQSRNSVLEELLRFGMYPKVHTLKSEEEKQEYLSEYISAYLYDDLLKFENVRKPKKVIDLLSLVALQIGKQVSMRELAQNLSISVQTVEWYLDVLEKMFIVVNLRGLSRNLRNEIRKTSKYYFVDVGLRNALIRNFNPLRLRTDVGELFENWFIMEKIKATHMLRKPSNFYFWRTHDQQEIDLVQERGGKLMGYECKWSRNAHKKIPKDWKRTYPNSTLTFVFPDNAFSLLETPLE